MSLIRSSWLCCIGTCFFKMESPDDCNSLTPVMGIALRLFLKSAERTPVIYIDHIPAGIGEELENNLGFQKLYDTVLSRWKNPMNSRETWDLERILRQSTEPYSSENSEWGLLSPLLGISMLLGVALGVRNRRKIVDYFKAQKRLWINLKPVKADSMRCSTSQVKKESQDVVKGAWCL